MLQTKLIASTLPLSACSLPNTIGLGYGQSFMDTPGVPFTDTDDGVHVLSVQGVWEIRPAQVELVNLPPPLPQPLTQEPAPVEPTAEDLTEALDTFILLHPWVQMALVFAAVVLVFIFRGQLGRLLARVIGKNGNGANGKTTPK